MRRCSYMANIRGSIRRHMSSQLRLPLRNHSALLGTRIVPNARPHLFQLEIVRGVILYAVLGATVVVDAPA